MAEFRNISDAMVVAAASGTAYAVAFAYRGGFASHFGLPPLLLSPNVGDVLSAAFAVGIVALSYFIVVNAVWQIAAPRGTSARARTLRKVLIFMLLAGLIAFQFFDRWQAFLTIAILLVFFGFIYFVLPLIAHRKVVGFENKLLAQEELDREAQQHSLVGRASHAFGYDTIRVLVAILVLVTLAYLVGNRVAKNQIDFFVLEDRPDYVVAAIDSNVVILASFDQKTLALTGRYKVERLSESYPWTFQKRHIGKLAAPETNEPATNKSGPSGDDRRGETD